MSVHVVGMGVLGSVLAWRLQAEGVPFTWEDRDAPVQAWKASTGCVYPGNDADNGLLEQWERLHDDPPWSHQLTTQAGYWYSQKQPPHGSALRPATTFGDLKRSPRDAVIVNVPGLVATTRDAFKDRRGPRRAGAVVVHAHGFHAARLRDLVWGWSARVRLNLNPDFQEVDVVRPAFVHRQGSYSLYAYPSPGRNGVWLAGSALVPQPADRPKALPIASKLDVWRRNFTAAFGHAATVGDVDGVEQGWRPRAREDDRDAVARIGSALVARPYYHSGVRNAPGFAEAVLENLA